MTIPCGDCKLGVIGGAVCSKCNGTGFVEQLPANENTMPEETPVAPVEAAPAPEAPAEGVPEVAAPEVPAAE